MSTDVVEKPIKNEDKENYLTKIKTALNLKSVSKFLNVKVLIPVILFLVLILLFFNIGGDVSSPEKSNIEASSATTYTTSLDYVDRIEEKLEVLLSNIKGAGKTEVMISIDSSPQLVIAENVEEKSVTTSSGTTVTVVTSPILVTEKGESNPLVLQETLPEIKGVLIVSQGAKDIQVKLNIISAVTTLLGIDCNSVQVFAGK